MFVSKTTLQLTEKVNNLRARVAELEEKICPTQSHDFVKYDERTSFPDFDGFVYKTEYYICTRCGKKKSNSKQEQSDE